MVKKFFGPKNHPNVRRKGATIKINGILTIVYRRTKIKIQIIPC
jgi:hypothetical protein